MANTGNTQQQINYGAAANDGQGDPLRTAFIKTDDNFDAIWNAGPVGSNITIVNNTVQANNTNGNIVLRPNGVGLVQANAAVVPNASNLRDLGSADLRFRAAYIGTGGLSVDGNVTVTGNLTAGNISYTGNVFVGDLQGSVYADDSTIMVDAIDNAMFADSATFGTANITGNVTADYFIGNGSLLTGIASSYGNAEVANFLASNFGAFGSNAIVTAGNVVASVIDTGAIVNEFPLGIQTTNGYVWQFAGNILRAPEGGTWQSAEGTEFISSNTANGFINLVAYASGNLATELFMEHGFVRIRVDNGGPEQDWNFRVSGTLEVPGDIIPSANGTQSLGNVTNQWDNLWVANNITTAGNVSAGNINTGAITFTNGAQIRDTAGDAVAFGFDAGLITQGEYAVAIGFQAGANTQGNTAIAIGESAGALTQGVEAIAIGYNAGANAQGNRAVAISIGAGQTGQGQDAIAIGYNAGTTSQTESAVAIGRLAGQTSQSGGAVAIGVQAGADTQSVSAVAIGSQAGENSQGQYAVAIGDLAGATSQGTAAVAIGALAGETAQGNNSIIINATNAALDQTTANTFTVAPVRNDVANVAEVMFYNTASKEITYGNTISVTGNITGGNVSVTGNITGNTAGFAIGYRDIPQVSFTGNATIAAADAGRHFYSTESTDYILTIADNSAVSWPVGTAVTVVNRGTGNITVAQASGVSLYLAGNSSAGNRTVSTYGMATVLNVAANVWMINGTGVA